MKESLLPAVERLRSARQDLGLSQAEVAARIGTTQSAIARLESGASDPRFSTVSRYAEAVGVDQIAVSFKRTREPSLDRTAAAVRHSLNTRDPDDAFRQVIMFVDAIRRSDPAVVRKAIRTEPEDIGDRRWDALLAGVAEYASGIAGLPVPGWASAPGRFLRKPWYVIEDIIGRPAPGLKALAALSSPPELSGRGVFIDGSSLESV
ncbi:helix-turn-helix domain-containing protein [Glycomyces rhizosphaerae]|uniref:Helix-turn-helix domain-containing protein n=1 Tax=Glycomyces rhizosphaerae TaxID=2054422 RepID=A0ABV7PV87_9ACTN